MLDYRRVYDEECGESGWARFDSDGNLVLSNEFKNYHLGQLLVLKADDFTIDRERTEEKVKEFRRQQLRDAEVAENRWEKETTERLSKLVDVEFYWGKKLAKVIGVDVCGAHESYWDFIPMFKVGRRADLIIEKSNGQQLRVSENEFKNTAKLK